jgi:cellulose synthase/poly-beta-1,6-N-acetylglucosamine synthase-like glycosyltransferase
MATPVFVLGLAFILYVLAFYPLLLDLRVRLHSKPIRKQWQPRTVSIVLPVYNGEPWIANKLQSILDLDYPRELLQILVISDGSTDRTDEIVSKFASSGVELIRDPHLGKAVALNSGMARATGEILFFTDARQPLESHSLRTLIENFADPKVGVASGALIIQDAQSQQEAQVGLYWRYEKWIRMRLSQVDSVLGATGCIYAMRKELAVPLPAGTLVDDMYLPLAAFFRGYRVILDPGAKAFDYPTSLESEFDRKVRTLAGVIQIIRAYPALLGPRNRMWIHFMSHKVSRLLLPYALAAVFVSSMWLPPPWAKLTLAGQSAFCWVAVLDSSIPDRGLLKRITSAARTFLVLMAAAICAVSILFSPDKDFWRHTKAKADL